MTPDFRISGLSAAANDRVLSLTVNDNAGIEGDNCSIVLDDRDYKLEWPPKGHRIQVYMGYKETGLELMGMYEIDQVRHKESQAANMEIAANAQYHLNSNIKNPITQPWDEMTLGAIVSALAGRNGYAATVHPALAGLFYDHLDQTEESDAHLLTRLADFHNAYAKYQDGKLLFYPRGETLGAVTVERNTQKQWTPLGFITVESSISATINTRNEYNSVKAEWHDTHSNERRVEIIGSGEPQHEIRHTHESKERAMQAASAKLDALNRGTGKIDSLVIPGDARVRAEMDLIVTGFRPEITSLKWIVESATHSLSSGGYKTTIKAQQDAKGL